MTSIRKYLITVLLAAITLINFLAALHGYRTSMAAAEQLFDEKLLQTANALYEIVALEQVDIVNREKLIANEAFDSSEQALCYQVWRNAHLVARSKNAPDEPMAELQEGYSEVNFNGYRWRVLTRKYVANNGPELDENSAALWLQIAERTDVRFLLAESVIVESVLPIVACLPIVGFIIWWVVGQGLNPLTQLAQQLSQKRSDDLSPIKQRTTTRELSQLVNSANSLLKRLDNAFEREKRFAANAAHELRTPISVLKVQLYNLQQSSSVEEQQKNAQALQQGVERLEHLVEQILTLHRNSHEPFESQTSPCNLFEVAQLCISECYPLIERKSHTIELLGDEDAKIWGDEFALQAMLNNIIGNAAKYTPFGGNIRLTIKKEPQGVKVVVEDSGPGIPEKEYERVFERFYRVGGDQHPSGEEGCGLGLSIVRQIADLHRATVSLSCSLDLGGLRVEIAFPMSDRIQR